jgi:RNA polymerase sigma-70 factor, ECF subfamily
MRVVTSGEQSSAPGPGALESLLERVAQGDQGAFESIYHAVAGSVLGLARRVLRDPAQSEEVAQEVLIEIWRSASRFDPAKASAMTWILTLTHRRAVDRVRSAQASADRDHRTALREHTPAFDEVSEEVEHRVEREQVRRCLESLTQIQRDAVTTAYYRGHTYPETADLLGVALGTIKTRIRDGLIRLRDCLGVTA